MADTLPRAARISLGAALAWCLLLLVGALALPVYGTASSSASIDAGGSATVTETTGSATLFEVNGLIALVVLAVPLAATLLVGAFLHWRVRAAAWGVTAVLGALTVLALMSVGVLVVPVVVALTVACSSAGNHAARTVVA